MSARILLRRWTVLPGFNLTLGYTLFYLSLIVLIPLSAIFIRSMDMGWEHFIETAFSERVLAAYRLSFGGALVAAAINTFFGLVVAWILVRYDFPLRRVLDAMVDLPFALPTAVAGISLTSLYAPKGWIGSLFADYGIRIAFTPLGVLMAMIFIGLPFVVRTVEPVLQDIEKEVEEVSSSLGASRWQTFHLVILPMLLPALTTGFALAFARAVGEYGSIIFIAGNIPGVSEIVPLLIIVKLEQYDYAGATAIASVMLVVSFLLLLLLNLLQRWRQARYSNA